MQEHHYANTIPPDGGLSLLKSNRGFRGYTIQLEEKRKGNICRRTLGFLGYVTKQKWTRFKHFQVLPECLVPSRWSTSCYQSLKELSSQSKLKSQLHFKCFRLTNKLDSHTGWAGVESTNWVMNCTKSVKKRPMIILYQMNWCTWPNICIGLFTYVCHYHDISIAFLFNPTAII